MKRSKRRWNMKQCYDGSRRLDDERAFRRRRHRHRDNGGCHLSGRRPGRVGANKHRCSTKTVLKALEDNSYRPGSRNSDGATCWECDLPGHIWATCPEGKAKRLVQGSRDKSSANLGGNKGAEVCVSASIESVVHVYGVIHSNPTSIPIDTASAVSLIHERLWESTGTLKKATTAPIISANGHQGHSRGHRCHGRTIS